MKKNKVKTINGRPTCTACGREWSAMCGDNEVPKYCDCGVEDCSDYNLIDKLLAALEVIKQYKEYNKADRNEFWDIAKDVCYTEDFKMIKKILT